MWAGEQWWSDSVSVCGFFTCKYLWQWTMCQSPCEFVVTVVIEARDKIVRTLKISPQFNLIDTTYSSEGGGGGGGVFTKLKRCKQTTGPQSVVLGAEMHCTGGRNPSYHVIIIDNGMEPHPEKLFRFMVMSNNNIDTHALELDDTTKLRSQSDVVLLGIKIDDKLIFMKHVSVLCTKASKQLNAFTCISKFLSYDSKKLVINSFMNSNFR